MSKETDNLVQHLLKYKDAVIILGNDAVLDLDLFQSVQENEELYSRKVLSKSSNEFWKFYRENIGTLEKKSLTSSQKSLQTLANLGIVTTVIDCNNDGLLKNNLPEEINYIQLKGDRNTLYCSSCKKEIEYTKEVDDVISSMDKKIVHCYLDNNDNESLCKGRIRPSTLFYNENYKKELIEAVYNAIFKYENNEFKGCRTHTLLCIGTDFEEDLLHDIMLLFSDNKKTTNNEEYFSIIVAENDGVTPALYEVDFATTTDINDSLQRLIELIKNDN